MRIPAATYRLQFTPDFGFRQAREIVAYLAELGVSDIYASPIFRARAGSDHGYDMVDPTELNPDLGTDADFRALTEDCARHQLGWLQDIVPNHMAFAAENPLLSDLLENGAGSAYRDFFDIDWEYPDETLNGKVLAPFLGSFFGAALENGELRLGYDEAGFALRYYDLRFPLRIESYLRLLDRMTRPLLGELGEEHPDYIQLLGVLYVLKTLRPENNDRERREQVRFIKKTLWGLYRHNEQIRCTLDGVMEEFNGRPGTPASFSALENLLGEQVFRLSFWKVATEEINYRRFFSINDLISLRMENPEVFSHAHRLILRLLHEGRFTGLRIDHIDGLYRPLNYLERLNSLASDLYLSAEKILEAEEDLPSWPLQGTTGYDFLNRLNTLFVDPGNERAFTRIYERFSGLTVPYAKLLYSKKRLIIDKHMVGDLNNLARLLKRIAGRSRYGSDITLYSLRQALSEIMALLPVYRTYLGDDPERRTDRAYLHQTLGAAEDRNPDLLNELRFIADILLLHYDEHLAAEDRNLWVHFVRRFQQFTGPLMAKGVEDTLLYVYNRLISLNEVGSSPERFGGTIGEFHTFNRRRQENWPHTMNATATHDTKRGEDVRARLNVLAEIPQEWNRQLVSWSRLNRPLKRRPKRRPAPDKNDEYFLYQTLLGSFPFDGRATRHYRQRIRAYAIKAVREAKVHTAWLKPDSDYEEAYLEFVDGILAPGSPFLEQFRPFQRRIARFGIFNSLSQVVLKIAAPGLPDFYQGSEFWDLNLVDPDNRRPVDYRSRRRALAVLRNADDRLGLLRQWLRQRRDGRIKLLVTAAGLQVRRRQPQLFREGEYLPLETQGAGKNHLVAFARRLDRACAVAVAPRFLTGLIGENDCPLGEKVWGDTRIPLPENAPGPWREVFSGRVLAPGEPLFAAAALAESPVALLVNEEAGAAATPD